MKRVRWEQAGPRRVWANGLARTAAAAMALILAPMLLACSGPPASSDKKTVAITPGDELPDPDFVSPSAPSGPEQRKSIPGDVPHSPDGPSTQRPGEEPGSGEQRRPKEAVDVSLEKIDGEGLANVIRRKQGKVVLVDFWATWCLPCREQFPHTVELHRRFAGQGLEVVSVSIDDPEDEAAARKFLISQGATFDNFLSVYGLGSEFVAAFDLSSGALPQYKLYGRSGEVLREFGGDATPEQIDAAVEAALKEPPPRGS